MKLMPDDADSTPDPVVEASAANTWARLSEREQAAIGAWLKEHAKQ